jgi:hypothetical protein
MNKSQIVQDDIEVVPLMSKESRMQAKALAKKLYPNLCSDVAPEPAQKKAISRRSKSVSAKAKVK